MSNENVIQLSQNDFEEIISSDSPVLVDFWASWCGPCRMMAPVIDQLADEFSENAKICKLNVDDNTEIASRYKVMSIPTVLIFKNGAEVSRDVGVKSKEYFSDKLTSML
ncbi:MAG: thioredoxin [Eubacteriaceae bacterium]|nr:thioredoxin [Eubacteriaceae bacterium]